MKWSSKVSEEFDLSKAMQECVAHVRADLGDAKPDLAIVFVSPHHAPDYTRIPSYLKEHLGARVVMGCSAGGVIGGGKEIEDRAGFALTAAVLPGVDLAQFHVTNDLLPDMDAGPVKWEELAGVKAERNPAFVVLADPFSIHGQNLLAGLDYAFPGRVKVGGLASGSSQPGGNALFLGDTIHEDGAVGIAFSGAVTVDTVVAQGCRPIGKAMVVTKCEQNVMLELDGDKPMDRLRAIYTEANDRDQRLINRALHLGVVTDPMKEQYRPGDFLIRNVIGIHRESEGIVVGELLQEGQVVQFHVRDAMTAEEDLNTLLKQYVKDQQGAVQGSGALLFSCLGRGVHLFGQPDHDTGIFEKEVGLLPLGGFFCNGEIGPVGPSTYLHGFTSSFAIFRPK